MVFCFPPCQARHTHHLLPADFPPCKSLFVGRADCPAAPFISYLDSDPGLSGE
jgi:hypothetical protein